ncbi:MAG: hypothetical protein IT337_16490 [Thermomicrobiales bacterium]|nr:hypothetical protein [Thermomicrobiales bacterium]
MDNLRFDRLIQSLAETSTPRRVALKALAGGVFGTALVRLGSAEADARKKKHKHHHHHRKPTSKKQLGDACNPSKDTCAGHLVCDTPTTRHTCSDSIPSGDWCCVPPGGSCTECDCCGNYYCEFDNNNEPHCVPNPEG